MKLKRDGEIEKEIEEYESEKKEDKMIERGEDRKRERGSWRKKNLKREKRQDDETERGSDEIQFERKSENDSIVARIKIERQWNLREK